MKTPTHKRIVRAAEGSHGWRAPLAGLALAGLLAACGGSDKARPVSGLAAIDHFVVVMLENRSFDHMLGYLYEGEEGVPATPDGRHPGFDGLTGKESNLDLAGNEIRVFKIDRNTLSGHPYSMPGIDPWEGWWATNWQLFGCDVPQCVPNPADPQLYYPPGPPPNTPATMSGFVTNWEVWLQYGDFSDQNTAGATAASIMGVFPPDMLPVLSTLAREYAVSDRWFSSAPTETAPNRGFLMAATSLGKMVDATPWCWDATTILERLEDAGVSWKVYGDPGEPLLIDSFAYTRALAQDPAQRKKHFGGFKDFKDDAAAGRLPHFAHLEPNWSSSDNNHEGGDQHPAANVALGERWLKEIYAAMHDSPNWNSTLLIITYDEHGGLYDHVPPPWGAVPPDAHRDTNTEVQDWLKWSPATGSAPPPVPTPGSPVFPVKDLYYEAYESQWYTDFDFTRYGIRVPMVLVSPRIAPHTLLRVDSGDEGAEFDHTSILKTVEQRFHLAPLTARDAAAPGIGHVLTLDAPRRDDPVRGVRPPDPGQNPPPGPTWAPPPVPTPIAPIDFGPTREIECVSPEFWTPPQPPPAG